MFQWPTVFFRSAKEKSNGITDVRGIGKVKERNSKYLLWRRETIFKKNISGVDFKTEKSCHWKTP